MTCTQTSPAGQFDKAAELCPKILGINAKLWEDWVFLFADKGQIGVCYQIYSYDSC